MALSARGRNLIYKLRARGGRLLKNGDWTGPRAVGDFIEPRIVPSKHVKREYETEPGYWFVVAVSGPGAVKGSIVKAMMIWALYRGGKSFLKSFL